jgi:TonB family protein
MPFDLLPRSSDRRPSGDRSDSFAEFDLDPAPIRPEEDVRLEPMLLAGPQWIEFGEADRLSLEPAHQSLEAALLVGFDEPDESDFDRVQLRAEEPPPTPSRRAPGLGMIGSLGVHLPPLLLLLSGSTAPGEVPPAIPVQLVIEAPPPEPTTPEPPAPPGPTRLASDDIGDTAKATPAPAPAAPTPPPPAMPRVAALVPPPKPSASAKPAVPAPAAARTEPKPKELPRAGRIPGPDATRDEYLAYLVSLTRQHVDLLPLSVIGDRRGETTLAVLVLGDGTIARIAIAQGSGYSDIDTRIQQIVAAVRRFPPLPQRFRGPDLELKLRFRFPDAVLGR